MLAASDTYYGGEKQAKQSSSPTTTYILIIASVVIKCCGWFMVGDLLQSMHVVTLLCGVQICASVFLTPMQKPFAQSSTAPPMNWPKILQLAIFYMVIQTIFLYSITLCGPLRAILVFNIPSGVITSAFAAIMRKPKGSPARTRGTVLLICGILALFLLDADSAFTPHGPIDGRHVGLSHVWGIITDYVRLADHNSGIVVLLIALLLKTGYEHAFKRLSVEYGGPKRVHSAVHLCGAIVATPFALIVHFAAPEVIESHGRSLMWLLGHMFLVAVSIRIVGFYADTHAQSSKTVNNVHIAPKWLSSVLTFSVAVIIARIWYAHISIDSLADGMPMHGLSAGVVITVAMFVMATIVLSSTSHVSKSKSHILDVDGYGLTGKTVFRPGEAFFAHTTISISDFARTTMRHIWAKSDSRRIFYFLVVNLGFCGVEFAYGVWTNSLGLVSDAFHMLFDCLSLVMGLVASVMAAWAANRSYSYGFGRVEVLSGFINALFLIVIALTIFMAAVGRLFDPPTVHTEKLLVVSVAGLVVNLFGIFAFHGSHGHSHGGGGDHGHSHGGSNANMYGVYLHILSDTGGSVAVIISTLLLESYGWKWVDPLCSLLLALLIVASVIPLIQESVAVLMQCSPSDTADKLHRALEHVNQIPGVQSYSGARCWQLNGDMTVASLHVQVVPDASTQHVVQKVTEEMQSAGIDNVTVQVESEAFFHKLHQIYPSYTAATRTHRPLHDNVMSRAI